MAFMLSSSCHYAQLMRNVCATYAHPKCNHNIGYIYCKTTLLVAILYFGSYIYLLAKIFTLVWGSLMLAQFMHCVYLKQMGSKLFIPLVISNHLHSYGFALMYFYSPLKYHDIWTPSKFGWGNVCIVSVCKVWYTEYGNHIHHFLYVIEG